MAASADRPETGPGIIRFSRIGDSPWINGGGSVKVLATGEEGTAGTGWNWRLSVADVGQSGEFSRLPGVDRILTIVEGGPLRLTIDGTHHEIHANQPFRFDGGAVTTATLPRGPVRNLNLMCRAGRVEGHVSIVPLTEHMVRSNEIVVLLEGHAQTRAIQLHHLDAVAGSDTSPAIITGWGTVAVVTIRTNPAPLLGDRGCVQGTPVLKQAG